MRNIGRFTQIFRISTLIWGLLFLGMKIAIADSVNKIQITNIPNEEYSGNYDWFGLYYHNGNSTAVVPNLPRAGSLAILRRLDGTASPKTSASAGSLIYFALDVDTLRLTPVTPEGITNGAFVRGKWMYVMERESKTQQYWKISRINLLEMAQKENLGTYPDMLNSGEGIISDLAVSSDGSYLIWSSEELNGNRHFYLKRVLPINVNDRGKEIDVSSMPDNNDEKNIEHFQFFSGDHSPNFTCIDQSQKIPHLSRIGVGSVDAASPSCTPFKTEENSPLTQHYFAHPFIDSTGRLWSDAIHWEADKKTVLDGYVRFDHWTMDGKLTDTKWFENKDVPFQVHTNFTMLPDWFLGDGDIGSNLSVKQNSIYLLHMKDGEVSGTALAPRGTSDYSDIATAQPNVHLIHMRGQWGALWSEWNSTVPGQPSHMNVFFQPLPNACPPDCPAEAK